MPATSSQGKAKSRILNWRGWLDRLFGVRLGRMACHAPRPLKVPEHYTAMRLPENPPTISIVTPSLNQGAFLERTVASVLGQHYPRLEYVVQDGGSTDQTVSILQRYRDQLKHWESAPDRGQASAINRGFRRTTGEVMAYLNSDDILLPGALAYVARYFAEHPDVDALYSHRVLIDEHDDEVGRWVLPGHDDEVLSWSDFVPQETLFWRRRLWERAGATIDESLQFAMDWDLLLRFRGAGARMVRVPRFLAGFRVHPLQKTQFQHTIGQEESRRLRLRIHGRPVEKAEIARRVQWFLLRHIVLDRLYRFGLLRH